MRNRRLFSQLPVQTRKKRQTTYGENHGPSSGVSKIEKFNMELFSLFIYYEFHMGKLYTGFFPQSSLLVQTFIAISCNFTFCSFWGNLFQENKVKGHFQTFSSLAFPMSMLQHTYKQAQNTNFCCHNCLTFRARSSEILDFFQILHSEDTWQKTL